MYRLLCRWLPVPFANLIMAIWYFLLIILLWLYWSIYSGGFRYLNL